MTNKVHNCHDRWCVPTRELLLPPPLDIATITATNATMMAIDTMTVDKINPNAVNIIIDSIMADVDVVVVVRHHHGNKNKNNVESDRR
jgi:hypothetical protein